LFKPNINKYIKDTTTFTKSSKLSKLIPHNSVINYNIDSSFELTRQLERTVKLGFKFNFKW